MSDGWAFYRPAAADTQAWRLLTTSARARERYRRTAAIYCAAMTNWQDGRRWVNYPVGHPSAPGQLEFYWHPLVIWSLVAGEWHRMSEWFDSFEAFLGVLVLAAVAPPIAGFFRARRLHSRSVESR
jgi:hypothetical protein